VAFFYFSVLAIQSLIPSYFSFDLYKDALSLGMALYLKNKAKHFFKLMNIFGCGGCENALLVLATWISEKNV
jgi:hypothetical protein